MLTIRLHYIILTLFLLGLLLTNTAYAVTPAEEQQALDEQQKILQNEQRTLELLKQLRKQEIERKRKQAIITPETPAFEMQEGELPCVYVEKIVINGVTLLKAKHIQKIIAPFENQCINTNNINSILRDITNLYVSKGYITSRIYIPKQDLMNGNLTLLVEEGIIEAFDYQGYDRHLATAFPTKTGDHLNLRDLEQGIDQMNRLSSNQVTLNLIPGKIPGSSIVAITNNKTKPLQASIGIDNLGQDSTGELRKKATFTVDNIFHLNDIWSLSISDKATNASRKDSESFAFNLSIPYGYWTLNASYQESDYKSSITGLFSTFMSTGDTKTYKLALERILHRNQQTKTLVTSHFTHKDTENFVEDVRLRSGSRKLSIAGIEVEHTRQFLRGILTGTIGYDRGLPTLGAKEDQPGVSFTNPKAQFDKFTSTVNYCKPLQASFLSLTWCSNGAAQWSPDTLFNTEQMSLGDFYTIRGFKEDALSGDSGAYIRNELIFTLPTTTSLTLNKLLKDLRPYLAYDLGVARKRGGSAINQGKGYLSGASMGIRNYSKYLYFDVTIAKALHHPVFIETDDIEFYLSASLRF